MYRMECTNCGEVTYSEHPADRNLNRCNKCESVKFGLKTFRWLDKEDCEDERTQIEEARQSGRLSSNAR